MTTETQIRLPEESDYFRIVGQDGETLWEGEGQKFAALMEGMEWEQVSPIERRLVSQPMPMEGQSGQ